jgi:hypothetical protein
MEDDDTSTKNHSSKLIIESSPDKGGSGNAHVEVKVE